MFMADKPVAETGALLYDNLMYLGVPLSHLNLELGPLAWGTAWAMLDAFAEAVATERANVPPFDLRSADPHVQRAHGEAKLTAESTLLRCADLRAEWSEATYRSGAAFTRDMDIQLYAMEIEAGRLASEAAEQLFRLAGTSLVGDPFAM